MKHPLALGLAVTVSVVFVILVGSFAWAAEPAWWTQQKRNCGLAPGLAYNDWNGVCNAPSAPAVPPVSIPNLPIGPGNNPAQMMNQMGQQMIMNGVQELLAPTPKTPEEIEAERQAEIARQQAEAARQKKIQDYLAEEARKKQVKDQRLDAEAEEALSLLPRMAPPVPAPVSDEDLIHSRQPAVKPAETKSDAFNKGMNDALQCISHNAGPRCSGATADQMQTCVSDYNAGFSVGDKLTRKALSQADLAGKSDGAKGATQNAAADPRATDGCRVEWIEYYNHGYFEGKHATSP